MTRLDELVVSVSPRCPGGRVPLRLATYLVILRYKNLSQRLWVGDKHSFTEVVRIRDQAIVRHSLDPAPHGPASSFLEHGLRLAQEEIIVGRRRQVAKRAEEFREDECGPDEFCDEER